MAKKTEPPKMTLDQFREHCAKVQALPIVHLIDRVKKLTEVIQIVKPVLSPENQQVVDMILSENGYGVPMP